MPPSQPAAAPAAKPRPLSPHLQVYKPQLTSGLSIMHRGTGIVLSGGMLLAVAWLLALAYGPQGYNQFVFYAAGLPGQIVLLGFGFSFFFHLCTGIRHLLWDAGWFLDIRQVYATGYIAVTAAFLLTAICWCAAYGVFP